MIKRGLTLGVILMASTAMAGENIGIDMRPQAGGGGGEFDLCGQIGVGTVSVDVFVTQTGGSDILLRMVKIDFANSDLQPTGITWDGANADLGHHYIFASGSTHALVHAGPLPPLPAPGPGDLGPNAATQVNLPGDGEVKVATVTFDVPAPGSYTIDGSAGASVHWGFGLGDGPISSTTPSGAVLSVSAGSQNLTTAAPGNESTLWRSSGNIVRLTFDTNITAPAAGDILVRALQAGGSFGADVSASFDISVEGGTVLRLQDTGSNLLSGTWVEVRNEGDWGDVGPFRVQYQVAAGDANEDGRVLPNDLSLINSDVPNLNAGDASRLDINGDGRVLPNDLSAANASIPYLGVAKPAGHDCE